MIVEASNQMPGALQEVNREVVRARRRIVDAARTRMLVQLAALSVVACMPLALLLYLGTPERQAVQAERDAARAACSRIYDAGACSCAVNATVSAPPRSLGMPDDGLSPGALPWGSRVESARVPIAMTADFVHRVQACMAGGASAPVD